MSGGGLQRCYRGAKEVLQRCYICATSVGATSIGATFIAATFIGATSIGAK